MDDVGMLRHLKLPAYYVPLIPVRLLGTTVFCSRRPQSIIQVSGDKWSVAASEARILYSVCQPTKYPSNINVFQANPDNHPGHRLALNIDVASCGNANLSESEKELLRWDHRLGHSSFPPILFLFRYGALGSTERTRRLNLTAAMLPTCPKCTACQFGKQKSRPLPADESLPFMINKARCACVQPQQQQCGAARQGWWMWLGHLAKALSLTNYNPVSESQWIISFAQPVVVCSGYGGKTASSVQSSFCGGCIFVDPATGLVDVEFQAPLNSHATITSFDAYKKRCADAGEIPQSFVADNGSCFTSKELV
eukprot:CAMPEP_0113504212 /NCGR_PEP_ID=MMETSP0014_2-20120614/34595_1 /TAXON_ID=2857 /ORGANISM="Nitzschia sp." /LENGTH=308 /DNA_ID=CAMNT_0000399307 /DNA_START=173 /DNA_END=1101 /DNA_ORIENTATION=+ /assembly_acc=CAM_ASM_000159